MELPETPGVEAPLLVLLVGAPGTGKSYLARLLASALGAAHVESDVVRKQLFVQPRYTREENTAVFVEMHRRLRELLAQERRVVFDATNLIESGRRQVYRIAERAGTRTLVVRAYSPEAVIAQRLLGRQAGQDALDASDADWRVFQLMRWRMDPISRPHFVVNTAVSLEPTLKRLLRECVKRDG